MKKILLIEDDRIIRENTAELLELSGYEVEVAENGKLGLDKVKANCPDLIICDIMMPELDGYGVLYLLSKKPETAGIPFIFLTAKSERVDQRKGMDLGADDFLTKPFQDMDLLNAVESRLKKHDSIKNSYSADQNIAEFQNASEDVLKTLSALAETKLKINFKTKSFVYQSGDYALFLYHIKEGKVKTYTLNEEGKELITDIYSSGDFFGYQPLLEDRNYTEFAETLEASVIYKIPKEDFLSLIHKNASVSQQFINLISKDLSGKKEELIHLAYSSVRKRVARKLQEVISKGELEYTSLTRTDLANMVGTTKETLTRIITELKNDEIIDIDGNKIILVDKIKLARLEKMW